MAPENSRMSKCSAHPTKVRRGAAEVIRRVRETGPHIITLAVISDHKWTSDCRTTGWLVFCVGRRAIRIDAPVRPSSRLGGHDIHARPCFACMERPKAAKARRHLAIDDLRLGFNATTR